MKPKTLDERAVRGAAEEAAKMYRWAMLALVVMACLKLLTLMQGRIAWYALLQEGVALAAGGLPVLMERLRLGLWGERDEALTELLHLVRAKAFRRMFRVAVAAMILFMVFDRDNAPMCSFTGYTLLLMHNHLLTQCRNNGWLHGLYGRPPKGWAALLQGLVIFAGMTVFVLGAGWLMDRETPGTGEIVSVMIFSALVSVGGVCGGRREYRDSQQVADEVLRAAQRCSAGEEPDDVEAQ